MGRLRRLLALRAAGRLRSATGAARCWHADVLLDLAEIPGSLSATLDTRHEPRHSVYGGNGQVELRSGLPSGERDADWVEQRAALHSSHLSRSRRGGAEGLLGQGAF